MTAETPKTKLSEPIYARIEKAIANYKLYNTGLLFSKYMHQRACGKMYQRYKINSFELDMLCSLLAHNARLGRQIESKTRFFDQLTGNTSRKRKYEGYLCGLVFKKFVNRYTYTPIAGSLCLGVTPLGWKVVTDYLDALEELENFDHLKSPQEVVLPSDDHQTDKYKLVA